MSLRRRSRLRRTGGLKRSPLKGRGAPLKPSPLASSSKNERAKAERKAVRLFSNTVLTRACGVCARCRRKVGRSLLEAHHLVPRARAPRWEHLHCPRRNGAALCKRCHRSVHRDVNPPDDVARWIKRPPNYGKAGR